MPCGTRVSLNTNGRVHATPSSPYCGRGDVRRNTTQKQRFCIHDKIKSTKGERLRPRIPLDAVFATSNSLGQYMRSTPFRTKRGGRSALTPGALVKNSVHSIMSTLVEYINFLTVQTLFLEACSQSPIRTALRTSVYMNSVPTESKGVELNDSSPGACCRRFIE